MCAPRSIPTLSLDVITIGVSFVFGVASRATLQTRLASDNVLLIRILRSKILTSKTNAIEKYDTTESSPSNMLSVALTSRNGRATNHLPAFPEYGQHQRLPTFSWSVPLILSSMESSGVYSMIIFVFSPLFTISSCFFSVLGLSTEHRRCNPRHHFIQKCNDCEQNTWLLNPVGPQRFGLKHFLRNQCRSSNCCIP